MTLDLFLNINKTTYLTCIQQLSRFFICFAKNDITPIQFNAKTMALVIHFFRKRILMTFDHVHATFLLKSINGRMCNFCLWHKQFNYFSDLASGLVVLYLMICNQLRDKDAGSSPLAALLVQ